MDLLGGVTWALCFVALALSLTAFFYVHKDHKQRKEREARSLERFAADQEAYVETRKKVAWNEVEKVREFQEALSSVVYRPHSLEGVVRQRYADAASNSETADIAVREALNAVEALQASALAIQNRPILLKALETARHELTTLHGLMAFDGSAPGEAWTLDTSGAVAQIDQAISVFAGNGSRSS